jgi:ribosomal protein S18 acetylase RimI-like enzyme
MEFLMNFKIRPFEPSDMEPVVALSLLAWEPVFVAWRRILGPDIYPIAIYPEYADWREGQQAVVEKICLDEKIITWVAEVDGNVAGFISLELNDQTKVGEVQLLAVHPGYQNQDIGTDLNLFALEKFKEGGMKLAVVGTGGDEGHAPARRSYEKAGYTGLPTVRYYQALD